MTTTRGRSAWTIFLAIAVSMMWASAFVGYSEWMGLLAQEVPNELARASVTVLYRLMGAWLVFMLVGRILIPALTRGAPREPVGACDSPAQLPWYRYRPLVRSDFAQVLILAIIAMPVYHLVLAYVEAPGKLNSTQGAAINQLVPIFFCLVAAIRCGDWPHRYELLGLLVGLAGAFIVLGFDVTEIFSGTEALPAHFWLAFLVPLSLAIWSQAIKHKPKEEGVSLVERYGAFHLTGHAFKLGALALCAGLAVTSIFPTAVSAAEFTSPVVDSQPDRLKLAGYLVLLVVVASLMGYGLWAYVLERAGRDNLPGGYVSSALYLMPIWTAGYREFFTDEHVAWQNLWTGLPLIAFGWWVTTKSKSPED